MELSALLITPFLGPALKMLFRIPMERVKKKARNALQQQLTIKEVTGEIHTLQHAFPSLAFTLSLDSKGFDHVFVNSINCVFLYKNIPLQQMIWKRDDEWASNLTQPKIGEGKLKAQKDLKITIFFNPIIYFPLWLRALGLGIQHREHDLSIVSSSVLELPDSKRGWEIEGTIIFASNYGHVSLKIGSFPCCRNIEAEDWNTICEESVKPTLERLGIRWILEI